ncbi:hypothetical protein V1227_13260 [Lentzea sp. DG1S-22]|uniref:hypothetical protein n=1 Tax=Lentzea sp. DG1S-22 TaxID=3108822 RepID=UPI002E795412|nr:hypothetical protein [Lentzea sp. DG1S-22]WVH83673.1 hypothetical protein V1227_13260 [Lentzea sp. DG1S-22]
MGRTATLSLAAVAALAAGLVVSAPIAAAAPDQLAGTLGARLGPASAGSYVDESGRLVVTVTGTTAARTAIAAGARARVVKHSAAALGASAGVLDRTARIPGTSGESTRSPTGSWCPPTRPSPARRSPG